MVTVNLELHPFDSADDAARVADDIRNRGSVSYVNAEGAEVSVTIGDVTVS